MNSVGRPLSGSEFTAQARRAQFIYAAQTFRLGAFSESMSSCVELIKRSSAAGDSLNFYASKRIATLIPSCFSCDCNPATELQSSESTDAAQRQKNMLLALEQHREGNINEAVSLMQNVCRSLRSWKNADEYTSSAYSWLATFSRQALLSTRRGHETTYQNLKRTYTEAVRNAQRIAQRFEEEKPHAYREAAWEAALFGIGSQTGTVLYNLYSSLLRARANGQTTEELATLQAWDSICTDYEFCIPEMPEPEHARFNELLAGGPSQENRRDENCSEENRNEENRSEEIDFCESLEETVAMMVSAFGQEAKQESNFRGSNERVATVSNW